MSFHIYLIWTLHNKYKKLYKFLEPSYVITNFITSDHRQYYVAIWSLLCQIWCCYLSVRDISRNKITLLLLVHKLWLFCTTQYKPDGTFISKNQKKNSAKTKCHIEEERTLIFQNDFNKYLMLCFFRLKLYVYYWDKCTYIKTDSQYEREKKLCGDLVRFDCNRKILFDTLCIYKYLNRLLCIFRQSFSKNKKY